MRASVLLLSFLTVSVGLACGRGRDLEASATTELAAASVTVDRGRFVVEVEGRGKDILLVPGLASSRAVWDGITPSLAAGHRVHRIQLAGFAGLPPADNASGPIVAPVVEALARYAREEHLDRPLVIGHSMGGLLALMLAQAHPELVDRVLIVDAGAFYSALFQADATSESMQGIAHAFQDQLLTMTDDEFLSTVNDTTSQLVRTESARPTVVDWSLMSDRRVMGQALFDMMTTDARPGLAAMTTPVTVLYAWDAAMPMTQDDVDQSFARVYAGLPGLRFQRVDDSFHFIMIDQPARFSAAVDAFVAR